MELTGRYRIPAAPGQVWQALNDTAVLRACIPGCEDLQPEGAGAWRARVTAKLGAIKASFAGRVALSEADPPHAWTISGEGSGGAAGFAKGSARVRLENEDGATVLSYVAAAEIGGKLASLGSRLVHGVAAKTADDFFRRLCSVVAEGGPMAAPVRKYEDNSAVPPERHGPPEATAIKSEPVPAVEPTVPYTLGQTPRQQNRIIAIGAACWVAIVSILLFAG